VTAAAAGALLGAGVGLGLWLSAARVITLRRGSFELRVLRHLEDIPQLDRPPVQAAGGPFRQVFGPVLTGPAARLERLVGDSAAVGRRIDRAGLDLTVHDFRVEQVVWGAVALAASSAAALLVALRAPDRALPLAVLCLMAAVLGVLLRENRLTAQVRAHESKVLSELPAIAELLALAVAAGEGPVAALERVVMRSHGAFSRDLARLLGEIRTGTPVVVAFDDLSKRTGLPVVARFASGISVAVERGTPLADVLHAQAGDVREAQRRSLIESGAKREVAMMIPVVFLVLPTTVLFAFWPGVVGLRMVTP
jgi:tight adherence protein C